MSLRSLLEFNHDCAPPSSGAADEAFGRQMREFLRAGDSKALPAGVTHIQTRHHSDPAPTGWMPPSDAPTDFRCLGWMFDEWHVIQRHPYDSIWLAPLRSVVDCRRNQPTAFLPMPPAPGEHT